MFLFMLIVGRYKRNFPGSSISKEFACNARDAGLIPESGRSPGERKVFLPGEFHVGILK